MNGFARFFSVSCIASCLMYGSPAWADYKAVGADTVTMPEPIQDDAALREARGYDTVTRRIPLRVPEDYSTIQGAIDAAEDGDLILVAPGTYRENLAVTNKAITIAGRGNPKDVVLHGGNQDTCIAFISCGSETIIRGFTITDGKAYAGGGIFCGRYSSPVITGNIISGNTASYGAGIFCDEKSSPLVENNLITSNYSLNNGAGIYVFMSSPFIRGNSFKANFADAFGGGIMRHGTGASCAIVDNIIDNNISEVGAGIYIMDYTKSIIESNRVTDNYASYSGGGIYCGPEGNEEGAYIEIRNNTVARNLSDGCGGGIVISYKMIVALLENNDIVENMAWDGGGIVFDELLNLTARWNRIYRNHAQNDGGGVYGMDRDAESILFENNLVVENSSGNKGGGFCLYYYGEGDSVINNVIYANAAANLGGGVYFYASGGTFMNNIVTSCTGGGIYANASSTNPNTYNDIWGNAGGNYLGYASPGVGDISEDPLFENPVKGDFRLREGSPCIDAGNPAPEYNDPDGTRNDMGAYGGPRGEW